MECHKTPALFITEQKYIDYQIPGGVQLCTAEFLKYFEQAGYTIIPFKVQPNVTSLKKIKIKLGIEIYSLYEVERYLKELVDFITMNSIKIVLFNQLNLAHWVSSLKGLVSADVKFIGLSHGNESGDYLHDITTSRTASIIQTWRLGRLLVKEKYILQQLLDGIIVISMNDSFINQWLGAQQVLFLPRILFPDFISWNPSEKIIGFTGTLNHLPNLQGIRAVADGLQNRNFKGKFKLVGGPAATGYALEKKYSFITYSGILGNEELIKEAESWSVFLNPVFWYSRGSSTKLAQGINWGLPVITTPAGARGYTLVNDKIVCKDNTSASFVNMLLSSLDSAPVLQGLKQASQENATEFTLKPWVIKLQGFIKGIQHYDA